MDAQRAGRRADLDNLRTFLTALVICHHSAIAFGASGGWYFVVPPPQGSLAPLLLTWFAAVNQSYFMALFFGIAGYFTPPAFEAKGARGFLRDRRARLGIPMLVYFFLLNPVVAYMAFRLRSPAGAGFDDFVAQTGILVFGPGPLWFVLALLLFSFAYAAVGLAGVRRTEAPRQSPFPDDSRILFFVIAMGLTAFLVRLVCPVGWNILGLQLGYFPLYIAFFVLGIRARVNDWLAQIDRALVRRWFRAAVIAIFLLPVILIVGIQLPGGESAFSGGLTLQSLLYALWEPVLCVGISLKLLTWFRDWHSEFTPLTAGAARSAYAAYILHPLFVVPLTAAVAALLPGTLLRFVVLCALALVITFAVSDRVRRAPGLSRIL